MKLTLEQKVFIEYGKARKALEIAKKQLAKEMRRYSSWHQARDYNNMSGICRGQVLHYPDQKGTPLLSVICITQR